MAFFLFFVYGCPRLYPWIERSQPAYLESNVADLVAKGDVRKALRIAGEAVSARPGDPMALTTYGRALLEAREADKALEQLTKAVGVEAGQGRSSIETRTSYYYAPARLTLGTYYLEQGKLVDAVENFELARAYAVPADIEYGDYHAALYQAYAKHGLWARALEFGEPSDQELDDLSSQDIVRVARVCEGEQNWTLASRLAEQLLTREAFTAEAHHLLGRVDLVQEQYEASLVNLEQAVSEGRAHSAFFLGTAFDKNGQPARAIQAFLRTPPGDLYRPFALAKALTLLANSPEHGQTFTAARRKELLAQLDNEIAGMRQLHQSIQCGKHCRFTPVAVMTSEVHFLSGGRFPVLILWEDARAPAVDPTRMSSLSSGVEDSPLLLKRTNSLLQLQWVENVVNWESVQRLDHDADTVPGWIDTARDWFALRSEQAAQVQDAPTGESFLSFNSITWFYSVPIQVKDGVGYLLAALLKDPQGKGSLGWQALDEEEYVLFEDDILAQERSDAWTWRAGYMRSQPLWDIMRVRLNVARHPGTVALDDVMLVEINEPRPTFLDKHLDRPPAPPVRIH